MAAIQIDADALFRAVTATGYKLLAYSLNLESGEIVSRTLRPEEVAAEAQTPSVKPLPKLGGDLSAKKEQQPFGPPPVIAKKNLFADDDTTKKPAFQDDFWKREEKKKPNLFGEEFKRESGSKKLAEIFSGPTKKEKSDPFAKPAQSVQEVKPEQALTSPQTQAPESDGLARIPAASEAQQLEWMRQFAKESGDPEIREQLLKALSGPKPVPAFERVLRQHQRTGQQWELYFRKRALAAAEAWLSTMGVEWELVEH